MLIEEYEKEASLAPREGRAVFVEVKSVQRELSALNLFSDNGSLGAHDALSKEQPVSADNGVYTLLTEGTVYEKDGVFYLSYTETAPEISESVETLISFQLTDPKCVTVTRNGEFSSAFTLCGGKRLFSTYNTPFGTIDMCIFARKVENSLSLSDGALSLDYAVELKGLTAQRTKMDIKVREIK